jgi:hypothetical protein
MLTRPITSFADRDRAAREIATWAAKARKRRLFGSILAVISSFHLPQRLLAAFHDLLTVFLKSMATRRRLGWRHPSNGKQLPAVLINLAE